jgi:hypothetical protein
VGAQSIARAQSIAHGHIGDNICKKKLNFRKTILTKIKRGSIYQQILEQKNAFLALKVENIMSQKSSYYFFFKALPAIFFAGGKKRILRGL